MTRLPVIVESFPIGSRTEVRLTLDRYVKADLVDLRTWAASKAGEVETRCSTKNGVSLSIALLAHLIAALVKTDALAQFLGLLEKGGAEG